MKRRFYFLRYGGAALIAVGALIVLCTVGDCECDMITVCEAVWKGLAGVSMTFVGLLLAARSDDILEKIRVYMINMERDKKRVCFESYDTARRLAGGINSWIYDKTADVDGLMAESMDDIFRILNNEHVDGYDTRSLSVSDVVEIVESDRIKRGFYYCDIVGWKPIYFDATRVGGT